ncbi:hypothetical protein V5O48_007096 [Marasmius crinis-equi]|uniref:Uncharacterized protein n=1 Tax=Marasmius crinis-equi TaxID=585013 RepID=A0ABR3FHN3_9AGAR
MLTMAQSSTPSAVVANANATAGISKQLPLTQETSDTPKMTLADEQPPEPPATVENPEENGDQENEVKPRKLGETGRYTFSEEQKAILFSKMPAYNAAPNRQKSKFAAELYDLHIKFPIFAIPKGRTPQEWKASLLRLYPNNAKKFKNVGTAGGTTNSNSKASSSKPNKPSQMKAADGPARVKPLAKLLNKLVGGVLTIKTGREAFGDAHVQMIERIMDEKKDSDPERVLNGIWDEQSAKVKEHWEAEAAKRAPVIENQDGFVHGLRALIQSCLQSGLLGRGGVAVVSCFDREQSDVEGKLKSETAVFNDWWDPGFDISDSEMVTLGDSIASKFHTHLEEVVKQTDLNSLQLNTTFPMDSEGNARFLFVNEETINASDARAMLIDWFKMQWVESGRKGPVRYTDIEKQPNDYYASINLPFGMKISNPSTDSKAMSGKEARDLACHFAEYFGVGGRVFSFLPPKGLSDAKVASNGNDNDNDNKLATIPEGDGDEETVEEDEQEKRSREKDKACNSKEDSEDDLDSDSDSDSGDDSDSDSEGSRKPLGPGKQVEASTKGQTSQREELPDEDEDDPAKEWDVWGGIEKGLHEHEPAGAGNGKGREWAYGGGEEEDGKSEGVRVGVVENGMEVDEEEVSAPPATIPAVENDEEYQTPIANSANNIDNVPKKGQKRPSMTEAAVPRTTRSRVQAQGSASIDALPARAKRVAAGTSAARTSAQYGLKRNGGRDWDASVPDAHAAERSGTSDKRKIAPTRVQGPRGSPEQEDDADDEYDNIFDDLDEATIEKISRIEEAQQRKQEEQRTAAWFKKPKYMSKWMYKFFRDEVQPITHAKSGRSYVAHPIFLQNKTHTPPSLWIHPPLPMYLPSMLNKAIERDELVANQHTSLLKAQQLSIDDSHKIVKHMIQEDGVVVHGSLWTAMTPYYIRSQALCLTKSHEERLGPLAGVAKSLRALGYQDPEVSFTGDPVKDKRLIYSVYPKAAHNTPVAAAYGLEPFKFNVKATVLSTVAAVDAVLSPLVEMIGPDNLDSSMRPDTSLCLSIDAEWNISCSIGVSILQLAPHTDPEAVYIIPVS